MEKTKGGCAFGVSAFSLVAELLGLCQSASAIQFAVSVDVIFPITPLSFQKIIMIIVATSALLFELLLSKRLIIGVSLASSSANFSTLFCILFSPLLADLFSVGYLIITLLLPNPIFVILVVLAVPLAVAFVVFAVPHDNAVVVFSSVAGLLRLAK